MIERRQDKSSKYETQIFAIKGFLEGGVERERDRGIDRDWDTDIERDRGIEIDRDREMDR